MNIRLLNMNIRLLNMNIRLLNMNIRRLNINFERKRRLFFMAILAALILILPIPRAKQLVDNLYAHYCCASGIKIPRAKQYVDKLCAL